MASTSTSSAVDIIAPTTTTTGTDSPSSSSTTTTTNTTSSTTTSSSQAQGTTSVLDDVKVDKMRTTKLSTSSSINESSTSPNLNSPSASTSDDAPLALSLISTTKVVVHGSTTSPPHIHNEMQSDSKNENNNKNNHSLSEELNEFSSSSISTLSSSSAETKIQYDIPSPTNTNGANSTKSDKSLANTIVDIDTSTSSPIVPIIDIGIGGNRRKREYNRRKSSDPVSVKKLPRRLIEDSDEDDEMLCNDEGDQDDFIADDEDFDDVDEYNFFSSSNNKPASIPLLFPTTRKSSQISRDSNSNLNLNKRSRSYLGAPLNYFPPEYHNINEEKLINSSNEEYETSITQSEVLPSHYNLRWKNHQTHILLAFESLLQNETFCDVTLVCDTEEEEDELQQLKRNNIKGNNDDEGDELLQGEEESNFMKGTCSGQLRLKAHKIVLSACSEYFQRILLENPCKHPVIVLKDYQAWEIQALLDFMYRGEVDVSLKRLPALVKSAESLQIRGLTDSIEKLGPNFHPDLFKPNQNFVSTKSSSRSNNKNRSYRNSNNNNNNNTSQYGRGESAKDVDDDEKSGANAPLNSGIEALNLSMDGPIKGKESPEIELPKSGRNINTGKPQNPGRETSMLQIQSDSEAFPTTTTNRTTTTATTNHHHHHHRRNPNHETQQLQHRHHLLPEDQGHQNSCNEGEINQNHADFQQQLQHALASRQQQTLMPRRKQARPRRRSGDYIAQDLRKVIIPQSDSQYGYNEHHINFDMLNRHLQQTSAQDEEENCKLEIRSSSRREDADSQQSPSHHQDRDRERESVSGGGGESGTGGTLMTRLASKRRSSRRLNQDRDLNLRSSMILRNSNTSNNNNNNRSNRSNNNGGDDNNGTEIERIVIDEEHNRVLDYTTAVSSAGNNKKHNHHKIRGITTTTPGLGQFQGQNHLPFLRNWSPTLGHTGTPPPGLRISPMKLDGDSDDGISSTADQCQSPPLSPSSVDPKHFLSHSRHPHDFPLFGLHPDHPHNLQRNLPSSLQFNKQSPPSPSNFFLGMGSMSMTPLGGGNDDSRANTPSTPPNPFSPAGFSMQLPLTSNNSHSGHQHHHLMNQQGKEQDRDGHSHERSSRGGGKDGTRGSPVGWPGLPLGPPPIFGRHRAQHSAPRGGPPRAWSNADLTEALHNVWNKKMTTSQASRIFGIPYNSLLMYVRGKYGKSLKLDLLKKGLDQALENSQNQNSNLNNSSGSPSSSSNNNNATSNCANNNNTTNSSTTSPTTNNNNNNNNNNSSSPMVKGHLNHLTNEHNNNNPNPTTGMGHLHHSHHHKSSKSAHHHGGIELPHDLPPGFNPFTAASIFGEYPTPFPFASALSHILPQNSLVNQQHPLGQHPGLGLNLNHSSRNDKVSVGDDEK